MADLAGAYADARLGLQELLAGVDQAALAAQVPACPAWTVQDLLAHVIGVAADAAGGTYFSGAADAWSDIRLATARDEWTAGQVHSRRSRPAIRLRAGDREWVEGSGQPAAALTADTFELFRALSGRRSLDQVHALAWDGDPEPYIDLLAPYPMPALPLLE